MRQQPSKIKGPVIFEEGDYQQIRQEYNPGVDRIPHDFLRFDPTELGNPLRELLRANDHWTFIQEKEGKEWELSHVKTEIENDIERCLVKKGLVGNQAALIRERMIRGQGSLQERFDRAVVEMKDDGPSYLHQTELVKEIVTGAGEPTPEIGPKRGDGFSTWAKKIPL